MLSALIRMNDAIVSHHGCTEGYRRQYLRNPGKYFHKSRIV